MTEETPNHRYNTPAEGEQNWHVPLNDNFERLDGDVPIWDTNANREEYTATSDAHFIAVDTGEIYEGDGDNWNKIGSITERDSGSSGETFLYDTVSPVANRVYVPRTGKDIQPAIDYFAENDVNGVVQLLPTTYAPPGQIELKGTVTLGGAGRVNTRGPSAATAILGENVAEGEPIIRFRTNDESLSAWSSQLTNLAIFGQRQEGKTVHGIEVGFVGNPIIDNCLIYECRGHGVVFNGTQSAQLTNTRIDRCGDAANDWHGLDLGGTVRGSDSFNRATVIASVMVGNGPASDAAPLKIRNGSTLRIKSADMRTGVRAHGPEISGPAVDIVGGDLVADNTLFTANLKGVNVGIELRDAGSLSLHNCTVEKFDPNIEIVRGQATLETTDVLNGIDYSRGGHGVIIPDSQVGKVTQLTSVSLIGNQGDGVHVVGDAEVNPPWFNVRAEGNDGAGIYAPDSSDITVFGIWRKDDDGKANGDGMVVGNVNPVSGSSND